jgi:hypothetical protein
MGFNEGGLSFDPDLSQFSNLQIMSSGFGYWIKVSDACTLVYPDVQVAEKSSTMKKITMTNKIKSVNPTWEWISVYYQGALRPGTVIQAKDPDGIICGENSIGENGFLSMMPVYRDDPRTEIDEGAEPGDIIDIYVNDVKSKDHIAWGEFGEVHQLLLNVNVENVPETFHLSRNYPNPFNPFTNIGYQLPSDSHVRLIVYNLLGEQIRILVNEEKNTGYYSVIWDGKNNQGEIMPSGIYFYQIKTGDYVKTQKMVFLR